MGSPDGGQLNYIKLADPHHAWNTHRRCPVVIMIGVLAVRSIAMLITGKEMPTKAMR